MIITSEAEMMQLGQSFAEQLNFPAVIELVGDVGAGKTTFTRGLAQGLGINEPITSPSFTISKRYAFTDSNGRNRELIHYDFYRLNDPGVMSDELSETLNNQDSIIVVEWGDEVANILPTSKIKITISQNDDNTRTVDIIIPKCSEQILWSST